MQDLSALAAALDEAAGAPPSDEAIAACDAVLAALGGVESAEARVTATRALFEKARALARLGRISASRLVVAELVRRHEHDVEPASRRLVCRALLGQARDRLAEENVDRRGVVVDYRHMLHIADRVPPIEGMAACALYHLALTHAKIAVERANDEHRAKALDRFVEVERRFGGSSDPEVARWVARSAASHALMHPLDAAGPVYDAVVARYQAAPEPELRALAAAALARWAERCVAEGADAEACALADRARVAFGADEAPAVRAELEACERARASAEAAVERRRAE